MCIIPIYLYGEMDGVVARPTPSIVWVKVTVRLAHEGRFEDIATKAVGCESPLVQVHLFTWSLEV